MFKNILVEATASLFGVRNSEANIKRSRVLKSTRRKLTALAKAAQESRRLHATLREQRRERMESARIKLVEAMLGQANRRPDHCRGILKNVKRALPKGVKIKLVPSSMGFKRQLAGNGIGSDYIGLNSRKVSSSRDTTSSGRSITQHPH